MVSRSAERTPNVKRGLFGGDHYAGRAPSSGTDAPICIPDGLNRKRIRWKYKQKRMAAYGMRKILSIHERP